MSISNLKSIIIDDERKMDFKLKIMENNASIVQKKESLKKLLTRLSFKYSETPVFPLSSGKMSNFYIDCKMTTLYSIGMALLGDVVYDMVKSMKIKGLGGLTLGADPIAYAAAMIAGQRGEDLVSFVIRKEPKKHGLKKWIEGGVETGDRVVVIDDVITTGGSAIQAIEKAEESGLEIFKVIILVDREEGGRENIIKKGYEVESLFTKTELLEEYDKINP